MYAINPEVCKKCKICVKNCPIGAIEAGEEKGEKFVRITDRCVECNICRRVCPFGAIETDHQAEGTIQCSSCSVQCKIPVGSTGACKRYTNEGGKLVRNRALVVEGKPQVTHDHRLDTPIITAVGAGTNYPCIRPAPHIVCEKRDGVDVVTTVTEAPLSYSGVLVKLDTNTYIGEEGATVYCEGKPVGMVQTEEYGSKMIYVGGANRLTAKDGGFATPGPSWPWPTARKWSSPSRPRTRRTSRSAASRARPPSSTAWRRPPCASAAAAPPSACWRTS